ncbi:MULTISPECIES: argininosuccinate lyase [unclassified Ruegeria]|nr:MULTISPECIES: argininosuccinate lyase [unclassified Ruegeria]
MTLLRATILVATCAVLAGCGADGEPLQPTMNASVGVGSSGTYVAAGVGATRGPISLFVGF